MYTVKEASALAGVSVRTLHHYHAIGLLPPTKTTPSGYRLYDDSALARLQMILLFRELEFPLKEIKAILDSPGFDQQAALAQQIKLLEMRRDRLDQILTLARDTLATGGTKMDFTAFDTKEMKAYAEEAKNRWGHTPAYREFLEKVESHPDLTQANQRMMAHFRKLGSAKELPPEAPAVQALVEELQALITESFYPCTPEILESLGQMYTHDPRFQASIDKAGGPGTAAFTEKAIAAYCQRLKEK